jgi:hypothetical protein
MKVQPRYKVGDEFEWDYRNQDQKWRVEVIDPIEPLFGREVSDYIIVARNVKRNGETGNLSVCFCQANPIATAKFGR